MKYQPQLIFDKVIDSQNKIKKINAVLKEALESNQEYQEHFEKIKLAKKNIQRIKEAVFQNYEKEIQNCQDIKIDLSSDLELFTDVVMNKIMKGESIEDLVDKYKNEYEVVYKVTVKKKK